MISFILAAMIAPTVWWPYQHTILDAASFVLLASVVFGAFWLGLLIAGPPIVFVAFGIFYSWQAIVPVATKPVEPTGTSSSP